MKQIGTQPIKTQRLILRRLTMDDLKDKYEWTGSAENSKFIMEKPHSSIDEAKRELQQEVDRYIQDDFYMWGIVYQDELIGYICGNEINEEIKSICIGYCIKKAYWNRNITTEATKAVIDYFFDVGFNRVFSYHHPLNPASGKVMVKSGMTLEGRIKGGSMLAGEICDCLQYAIVRSEWKK